MTELIGLYKVKLSQARYKKGSFYLSIVLEGKQVKALDGRFILEGRTELTPTKNGFRIPLENLNCLRKVLEGDLRDIVDTILFDKKSFHFHVRYLNDKYGEGIDFRKYRVTDKYTEWDKSGIRMKLENVITIRKWLVDFDPQQVDPAGNIFVGKSFCGDNHTEKNNSEPRDVEVSPDVKKILDF